MVIYANLHLEKALSTDNIRKKHSYDNILGITSANNIIGSVCKVIAAVQQLVT